MNELEIIIEGEGKEGKLIDFKAVDITDHSYLLSVPEGQLNIAHLFKGGTSGMQEYRSPVGTIDLLAVLNRSVVPTGLRIDEGQSIPPVNWWAIVNCP